MAKKSSFFEKLTGASWSKEEDLEEQISSVSSAIPQIQTASSKKTKPKTSRPKKSSEPKKNSAVTMEIPTEETSSKKDWLGESEGQLTIDVYQTPSEIVIKSTIAGVKPEDIDITMNNDMITIKGTRQKDENVAEEDYYYQECYWGPFSRSIILPVDVEVDQVGASMKNGILTVRLPKIEKAKTKKIAIVTE